jgi:hypothetical protein
MAVEVEPMFAVQRIIAVVVSTLALPWGGALG